MSTTERSNHRTVLVAAALGLAALLYACEIKTLTASEYCAQIPAKVCARLFDEACALVPASSAPRYASTDECEAAEKAACEARVADARLTFNGEAAAQCVTDLNDADCEKAARMQVHSCDKVFTDGDAGVAPIEAFDTGIPDAGDAGGDL